jgi:hypothetical protein
MTKFKPVSIATLWTVLMILLLSASEAGQVPLNSETVPIYRPKYYPFEKGEKAVYRASWNGMFSVATAEIYTTPTVIDGRKVFQVRVEAKSSRSLDLIWKMRDTISSTFDAKDLAPSKFKFSQRENSKVVDTDAVFDTATGKWVINRQQAGKRAKVYDIESRNTLDPITAVYLARSLDCEVGDRLYFNVFGGRYQYLLELAVAGKEPVRLESGKAIEAFKIIPRVQNTTKNGYASRLNDAAIWISADERRLPVKLSSKISFGTVYLELIQDARGTQATAAENTKPSS